MATINIDAERVADRWNSIGREFPPLPATILRGLCERIEKGGKTNSKGSGRRIGSSLSDEQLLKYFEKEFKEIDIETLRKLLMNIVRQLTLNCIDHCEDFGMRSGEICKRKFCVHKSIVKVLSKILHAEIHVHLTKEKGKVRKRRVEVCWDD